MTAKDTVVNVGAIAGTAALVYELWRRGTAGAFRIPGLGRFLNDIGKGGGQIRPRP